MDQIEFDYVDENRPMKTMVRWMKMQVQIITLRDLSRALAHDMTQSLIPIMIPITFSNAFTIPYIMGTHTN